MGGGWALMKTDVVPMERIQQLTHKQVNVANFAAFTTEEKVPTPDVKGKRFFSVK
jgi:hypothetical protein